MNVTNSAFLLTIVATPIDSACSLHNAFRGIDLQWSTWVMVINSSTLAASCNSLSLIY